MERAVLSQRITSILSDISRLTNALYALNTTDLQRYRDNYEVLSTPAALRAERIACRLRHLLYATTSITRDEYLTSAAVMQGIEIRSEDGILEITLPCLHPKRKQRQSMEYLLDPFTAALSQYAKSNPMPRLRHCVVCFSLVYSRELPERRVRDYKPSLSHGDAMSMICGGACGAFDPEMITCLQELPEAFFAACYGEERRVG